MSDLDKPKHPVAWASQVSQIDPGTGRSWVQKGWLKFQRRLDQRASSPGATTLISGRRVMQMAIAAALVRCGLHPVKACTAAYSFTDIYDAQEAPGHRREPGELYAGSMTVLAAYPDHEDGTGVVMRLDSARLQDVFWPLGGNDIYVGQQGTAIVVLLDPIVKHVMRALESFDCGEEVA
jgi:hypothetical protein